MSMTLAPRIEDQIQQWIDSGNYPDADSVIGDALRLLEERRLDMLRAQIAVGLDQLDRGEGIELTSALWDEIERDVDERLARGESPAPDVDS